MPVPVLHRTLLSAALALLIAADAVAPARGDTAAACAASTELTRLALPLPHVAGRISASGPLKIVAIGSSSTAGAGASSSASSYPSRLEAELRARFPQLAVTVLNRGVNGEEAAQMLARFDRAVVVERPDLVIWQVGTNALLHHVSLEALATTLQQGLERLKSLSADVIVIDPQFAPQVIATDQTERMLSLISASTKMQHVSMFHRYALMRYWSQDKHFPIAQFISPDGLHMNDWGYACWAKVLAEAIVEAATRVQTTARAPTLQQR